MNTTGLTLIVTAGILLLAAFATLYRASHDREFRHAEVEIFTR